MSDTFDKDLRELLAKALQALHDAVGEGDHSPAIDEAVTAIGGDDKTAAEGQPAAPSTAPATTPPDASAEPPAGSFVPPTENPAPSQG